MQSHWGVDEMRRGTKKLRKVKKKEYKIILKWRAEYLQIGKVWIVLIVIQTANDFYQATQNNQNNNSFKNKTHCY